MLRPRAAALAVSLAGVALGAAGRCDPSCPPRIELAPELPRRTASQLRAGLASLAPGEDRCGALRVLWEGERAVVELTLRDGRVARRPLPSLADALPTALALLATPPEEPEALAPPPPTPPEVPVTPEPPALAPAPQPAPVVVQPAPEPALRLRVAGALGAAWNTGRAFFVQRSEVDLRYRRLVIGLRGDWGARDDGGEELRTHAYGLAVRWLTPLGRWEFELGAVIAAAGLRTEIERGNSDRRTAWSLRGGVDLGAARRLTRALSAFVRVEGLASLAQLTDGPAPSGTSPFSVSASMGLRLEVAP